MSSLLLLLGSVMPIYFNSLLREAGFPLCDVRLVRHADKRPDCDPFGWWCDDLARFEDYQSVQKPEHRETFSAPYWAVFVGTPDIRTLFAGIYSAQFLRHDKRDGWDHYELTLRIEEAALSDLIGRLYIDWGEGRSRGLGGEKAFKQYAHKHNKPITELLAEPISRPGLRGGRQARADGSTSAQVRVGR